MKKIPSLKYYRFTREMLAKIKQHKIKGATRDVFDVLHLNQTVRRHESHPLTIEEIAIQAGCKERSVYIALAKLEKAGLFDPQQWGTVKGLLPMVKLDNETRRQEGIEKKEAEFYGILYERVHAKYKHRRGSLPNRALETLYGQLCQERDKNKEFYPDYEDFLIDAEISKRIRKYVDETPLLSYV